GSRFESVTSSLWTTKDSASCGTFAVHQADSHVCLDPRTSTNVLSVASTPIMPSHGSAVDALNDFLSISTPLILIYHDFSDSVHHRPSFDPSLHIFPDLFTRIHQPYSIPAFQHFLTEQYSLLITNLSHGFPI
ncbi:hypothetical protein C8J56DRAFT_745454, partial [Mycena floridula]